jgi:hypothetical protein
VNRAPWPARTTADDREQLEERAAIMEYDGKLPRAEAERRALVDLEQRREKGSRA